MNKSNKRASNFTKEEEETLITLVKKFASVIENKKTDAISTRSKKTTWQIIEDEFNMISRNGFRDKMILKNKYENIKKATKIKYASEKRNVKGTGGGPAVPIKFSKNERLVGELLGPRMTGNISLFDCDNDQKIIDHAINYDQFITEVDEDADSEQINERTIPQPSLQAVQHTSNIMSSLESKFTKRKRISEDSLVGDELIIQRPMSSQPQVQPIQESKLKFKWRLREDPFVNGELINERPMSPQPQMEPIQDTPNVTPEESTTEFTKRRRLHEDSLSKWASEKRVLTGLQITAFKEKHQLEMDQLRETHERLLVKKEAELDLRIKFMKEEHDLKMKLLNSKLEPEINFP